MEKGVRKSSQMSLKMSGHMTRYRVTWTRKLSEKREDQRWRYGKTPGSGLDDYVLDLMKLN